MKRSIRVICISAALAIAATIHGQRPPPSADYIALKKEFIAMPIPVYTMELRRRHITGAGIFTLSVDEKGKVTDVTVRKSTGNRELDAQAIYGLRQWRAKLGTRRQIDVPLTFSLPEKRGPSL